MADIDRRIAVVPSFTGLRQFHEGRNFKQWTGDDSKALMKIYIPAISGRIPFDMVRAVRAFVEFCYLARRSFHNKDTIQALQHAMDDFHKYRVAFEREGVRVNSFNQPRQHSLIHYPFLIWEFGAPNGLCSSITEAKHIKAVKEPYRRSNRYNAIGQMILTNQRLDKLAACRVDFTARGMLNEPLLISEWRALTATRDGDRDVQNAESPFHLRRLQEADNGIENDHSPDSNNPDDDIVEGPTTAGYTRMAVTIQRQYAKTITTLATDLKQPKLLELIRRFLYNEDKPCIPYQGFDVALSECPYPSSRIHVYHSAACVFHAPSDPSGLGGMRREHIRVTPRWFRTSKPRFDSVFLKCDQLGRPADPFCAARVLLLFSIKYKGIERHCALVHWYEILGEEPDEETGMWIVRNGRQNGILPNLTVVNIDWIFRAVHLIAVYGATYIPRHLRQHDSLEAFKTYYVNKFADHHVFDYLHC